MPLITIPTTARLPSSLRIDAQNPAVSKILSRLSRASLLTLALDWLDEDNQSLAAPFLLPDDHDEDDYDDDAFPPAPSLDALRQLYTDLQARKGSKRDVLDRFLEGDWRHGLTLYQLAMADLQYLHDHPLSQKWAAYRITPLSPRDPSDDTTDPPVVDKTSLVIPRFHPSTFLSALQARVLPDVKAHYNFDRHRTLPLLLLRIFILDSPYNTTTTTTFFGARTVYLAFPDASPHVFVSRPQSLGGAAGAGAESKSLHALLLDGVPKALSRPRQRFALRSTKLVTRNLEELIARKGGAQRTGAAAGGWGVYADEKVRESPLETVLPTPPLSEDGGDSGGRKREGPTSGEERAVKRARLVARARFGGSARVGDGKGSRREAEGDGDDGGTSTDKWRPYVRLTFHGTHVFAGIRQLVEHGIIDGERMPGWMTGEEGVTVGAVRDGRIRGFRGSGV
ncbi:centromere protein Chl4/mis15/CENP-N [Schizothecium vesticola]|uniref:Centromere protein Chl4/mis15/CENP-N n=1 Tax=Schizothecium vesticola TaxID=314040 RepID=A0AA40EJQ1_9PEZI|nr:centromere protein Chl4/mis15/CENP-N [Schizothecium vesticola]